MAENLSSPKGLLTSEDWKTKQKQVVIIRANTWNSEAPTTRIRSCLKTESFLSNLNYRPHAVGENGHRKRIFSKTLSTVKILKKLATRLPVDGWKRWCYTYYYVTHTTSIMQTMWGVLSYFFENGGKNLRGFQTKKDTCGRGPSQQGKRLRKY